jgi:disulfide bond formation protein DsbB
MTISRCATADGACWRELARAATIFYSAFCIEARFYSEICVLSAIFDHPRRLFGLIAVVCAGMLAFGILYLQNVVGLDPCPMCIVQRYCLILVGVFSALAAFSKGPTGWRLWGFLAVVVGGFGAFTAARQSWLQWNPPEIATCGRDLYGMIESFPLQRAIPMIFKGSGDCTAIDWTFLGGTIANWSFVWFVIFIVAILITLVRPAGRRAAR